MAAKPQLQSGEGSSRWKSSTAEIPQPKFFKIIFSQRECSRLRIPEHFASRYCKNMLNPVYLEVPTREVWEVEVVLCQGQICLGSGWQDFHDFYSISCGHFLMFGYNARSHFNVTIFDLGASEIEYPYSSSQGIHTPIFHCHETRHASKRDQSESDDSVEIPECIPRSHKAKAIIPDTVEHSVENLGHCPLGQSSKRKGQEGDAEHDVSVDVHVRRMKVEKLQEDVASPSFTREGQKHGEGTEIENSVEILDHCPSGHGSKRKGLEGDAEDDVSAEIHTRSIKVEKSREDLASPSFTRKTKKSRESCRMHKQQPKIVYDNKTTMDKERAIAYHRAKAFKSKNPFILAFMQPSYVSSPYILSISLKFARKYFLEKYGNLVLCVPGRGSWSVKCTIGPGNAKLFWKKFVLDNELKLGDVCVFEVIKGSKPLMDVTIFPADGSIPMHKIAREETGVSDGKNKIIDTDNFVPWSQPKTVHSRKLKQRRGGSYGSGSNIKEENGECAGIEHSVEILGCYPLRKSSKRKRPEGETQDAVSIDIHTKGINVENRQEDVASPSITRKTKRISDSKNKSIKTEKSVSCSQPKIVRSRKLNLEKKQNRDSDGFTSKIKEEFNEDTGKHVQQSKSSCKGKDVD